jgi:hypothetical protein
MVFSMREIFIKLLRSLLCNKDTFLLLKTYESMTEKKGYFEA